jgi:hypothetical protein
MIEKVEAFTMRARKRLHFALTEKAPNPGINTKKRNAVIRDKSTKKLAAVIGVEKRRYIL